MNFGIRWDEFTDVVRIVGVTLIWWHGGKDDGHDVPPLFRGLSIGLGWGCVRIGWHWDVEADLEEKLEEQEAVREEHPEVFDE